VHDQTTPLVFAPVVDRVTDCEFVRVVEAGVMFSVGARLTTAVACLVVSALLVAVMKIVWAVEMGAGAV
jgi:hypothetical protein